MTGPQRPFELVVGVDLSDYADIVLQHAFDEAVRHDHPSLHLLTVVQDHHGFWRHPTEAEINAVEEDAKHRLFEIATRTVEDVVPPEQRRTWRVRLHVRRGRPEQQLADLAAEVLADLIVVGRFGHSSGRRGVGSVADRVVASADCPVLVVSPARDLSASQKQCPACVALRAETNAEQWFCARHQSDRFGHTTMLDGMPLTGGGIMW